MTRDSGGDPLADGSLSLKSLTVDGNKINTTAIVQEVDTNWEWPGFSNQWQVFINS